MSERFHIHISASFVSLTVCFALSLILVFGSVSSSSSPFSLALFSPFLLNTAFAVDMEDAPANTDAPPKDNKGDNNDGDGEGNIDDEDIRDGEGTSNSNFQPPPPGSKIVIDEDNNDNSNRDNQRKQGSNEGPKAIEVGKCSDPSHEHDPFTNECKPVAGILGFSNECNNLAAPIQCCSNQLNPRIGILSPDTNNCVNAPLQDESNEQSNVLVTGDNELVSGDDTPILPPNTTPTPTPPLTDLTVTQLDNTNDATIEVP